jgi:hypothetical protein
VHEGFDPDEPTHVVAHRIMSGGWRGRILPALRRLLDQEASEPAATGA